MRTGDMRVIKQLDAMNFLLQKITQLLHPLIAPAFLAFHQLELLFMRIFGIGKHHIHQLQLISAKRLQYLCVQNFFQMRNIILLWYENFLRQGIVRIILQDKGNKGICFIFI